MGSTSAIKSTTLEEVFELHVWCPFDTLPSFSPDCLAAIWYITQAIPDQGLVQIYQSSNTNVSPIGILPALKHKGKVYSGYVSIVQYLKNLTYDLDSLALTSSELNTKLPATLTYLETNLGAVSQYLMYCSNKNYEKITRPLLSNNIPFPMQYYIPSAEKKIAESQCASFGLTEEGASKIKDFKQNYPQLSQLHATMEEQKKKKEITVKEMKNTMKLIMHAHDIFDNIVALGEENFDGDDAEQWQLFPRLSSADLLLLAHLIIQTHEKFPDRSIRSLLESDYPQLIEYINRNVSGLHELKMNISNPKNEDLPTLLNVAANWVTSLIR